MQQFKSFIFVTLVFALIAYFAKQGSVADEAAERTLNKRFVVTGASQGIGRSVVEDVVKRNASHVVMLARSENKLKTIQDELRVHSPHVKIDYITVDLSDEAECTTAIQLSVELMGGLDYLVLNHITDSSWSLWHDLPDSTLVRRILTVNTMSYMWLFHAALPALEAASGQVAVVSSVAGKMGVPHAAVYSASKHALHGFFESLRSELRYFRNSAVGITLCIIGATNTEGTVAVRQQLQKVSWVDPALVADAIVTGSAVRRDEVYYPLDALLVTLLHKLSPSLAQYLMHLMQA